LDGLGWKGPSKAVRSNPPALDRDILARIRLVGAGAACYWQRITLFRPEKPLPPFAARAGL